MNLERRLPLTFPESKQHCLVLPFSHHLSASLVYSMVTVLHTVSYHHWISPNMSLQRPTTLYIICNDCEYTHTQCNLNYLNLIYLNPRLFEQIHLSECLRRLTVTKGVRSDNRSCKALELDTQDAWITDSKVNIIVNKLAGDFNFR